MKILVTAATENELLAVSHLLKEEPLMTENHIKSFTFGSLHIDLLVSGIGPAFTAYALAKQLTSVKYDLAIQIGIAGSFNKRHALGDVFWVKDDEFADLGIDNKTLFEKGYTDNNQSPFKAGLLCTDYGNILSALKSTKPAKAITLSMVKRTDEHLNTMRSKFNPDIETMEGASFLYACMSSQIPCIQLRSISNYVEQASINDWNIPLALTNLSDTMLAILNELKCNPIK